MHWRAEERGCNEGGICRRDRNLGWVLASSKGRDDREGTDLEAILTCVSALCDVYVDAFEQNKCTLAKCQSAQIVGCQSLQIVHCGKTCLGLVTVKLSTWSGTDEPHRETRNCPLRVSCLWYSMACVACHSVVLARREGLCLACRLFEGREGMQDGVAIAQQNLR